MSSCGGEEFTSSHAVAGSSEQAGGGAGDHGGAPGTGGQGGPPSAGNGGSGTAQAGTPNGSAGISGTDEAGSSGNGDAGAAGAWARCTALKGAKFEGHCYVDATTISTSQAQAIATCEELWADGKVSGHLLVLESAAEQNFILEQFMVPFTDMSDAWLGLTCDELTHPDINDCYCMGCTKAALTEKQRAWDWLGEGSSSTFGWINGNPNGGFRCAALAYNPDLTVWGWVDRPCDKASVTALPGHLHAYRTLCEFEP